MSDVSRDPQKKCEATSAHVCLNTSATIKNSLQAYLLLAAREIVAALLGSILLLSCVCFLSNRLEMKPLKQGAWTK